MSVSLIKISKQQVQKYLNLAIQLTLAESKKSTKNADRHEQFKSLSQSQKVIVSKIYKNLSILCKLPKKQVKDILKVNPQYQQAIAQLFFDKHINNTLYISGKTQKQNKNQALVHSDDSSFRKCQCVGIQYRIQFTLSSINHKKVMQPLILIQFIMKNGTIFSAYFDITMFGELRKAVASRLKDIYTVQMKAI